MSYRCLNPEVFQGDPSNPPEYVSDRPWTCVDCGLEGDLDEEHAFLVAGGYKCYGCVLRCSECRDLLESEESVSEPLYFGKHAFCDQCFANMLCPWWASISGPSLVV